NIYSNNPYCIVKNSIYATNLNATHLCSKSGKNIKMTVLNNNIRFDLITEIINKNKSNNSHYQIWMDATQFKNINNKKKIKNKTTIITNDLSTLLEYHNSTINDLSKLVVQIDTTVNITRCPQWDTIVKNKTCYTIVSSTKDMYCLAKNDCNELHMFICVNEKQMKNQMKKQGILFFFLILLICIVLSVVICAIIRYEKRMRIQRRRQTLLSKAILSMNDLILID
ncbi:unnamed protein product, partial [Didymodactylos carnosus]